MYYIDCIHMKYYPGTYYDPPEAWCKIDDTMDCENCPYYEQEEDYQLDLYDELIDF